MEIDRRIRRERKPLRNRAKVSRAIDRSLSRKRRRRIIIRCSRKGVELLYHRSNQKSVRNILDKSLKFYTMDCRERIADNKKNKHPNTRQLCSTETRGREKRAALVSLRIFEKKERKVGRHGGSRGNRYKYTRVIFEGRDAYLWGGAGRSGGQESEKTNGTDWFPAAAAAAGFRGRARVCHRRQETLAPVNNPIKMDRKPWQPRGPRPPDATTALLLSSLLMPLQVLLQGGGRGDPRCLWNSY